MNDPNPRPFGVDPGRSAAPPTGIYVRARAADGQWTSADIAHLDGPSLLQWLRSEPGRTELVLLSLMGHDRQWMASVRPEDRDPTRSLKKAYESLRSALGALAAVLPEEKTDAMVQGANAFVARRAAEVELEIRRYFEP